MCSMQMTTNMLTDSGYMHYAMLVMLCTAVMMGMHRLDDGLHPTPKETRRTMLIMRMQNSLARLPGTLRLH